MITGMAGKSRVFCLSTIFGLHREVLLTGHGDVALMDLLFFEISTEKQKMKGTYNVVLLLGAGFLFFHARMEETTGIILQEQILHTDVDNLPNRGETYHRQPGHPNILLRRCFRYIFVGESLNASFRGVWMSRDNLSRWWFQIFYMFTPIWGNDPI